MFQGFYNLASGMITQSRSLNVISNNMANVTTPGYKQDSLTTTTFQQEMMYRSGNQDRSSGTQLGQMNMIRVPEQTITDYSKGNYVETGNSLDFAIQDTGFFKVEDTEGNVLYTRNGSFYIDEEGYLALRGGGRVLGTGGEIFIDSDDIAADGAGGIYDQEGELIDSLEIVDFEDYANMTKVSNGLFASEAEEEEVENPMVLNETLEQSNAEPIQLMEDMITSQRSLQSAAQILRMYDQMMSKAASDMGRM